jgi:ferredoxin
MATVPTTPCAFCPRLCRHACPVAVATGMEAAVPSNIFALIHAAEHAGGDVEVATSAASLCLGCGACTSACAVEIPVAERLRAWRAAHEVAPVAHGVGEIEGYGEPVLVGAPEHVVGSAAALVTRDGLGHAAWRLGDDGVLAEVRRAFHGGRTARAVSGDVAEVLTFAGVAVERAAAPRLASRFRTCFEGADVSAHPGQLACCGRREGFAQREPLAARAVADANVEALAGARVGCGDQACADWLRAHGANIVGPLDAMTEDA